MAKRDNRWCLICQPRNRTLYWHENDDEQIAVKLAQGYKKVEKYWCYCNKCDRAYTLSQYCDEAGIDMQEFLESWDMTFQEAKPDEVSAMAWPHNFIPLSDPRAQKGVDYIKSRGLSIDGDMYYDMKEEGIVFPYYVENHFCGAQVRFLNARLNEDGSEWKVTTIPGTRLGLLFYGWNQGKFLAQVKGLIVTEGAFNALSIQQALNVIYNGVAHNPWRVIACSGSGATEHQAEALKQLKDSGLKVVVAPDTDEAGMKMYQKFQEADCVTHYAFTGDTTKDWNDVAKDLGPAEFAKFVIRNISPVNVDQKENVGTSQ